MILKTIIFSIVITIFGIGSGICANDSDSDRLGDKDVSAMEIQEALEEHTGALMSLPGVFGVGQGLCDGEPCIRVYVAKKTPQLEQEIHDILGDYPVAIEESGEFRARPLR